MKQKNLHTFAVELKSKNYINLVTMPNGAEDNILIEGFIGDIEEIDLVEGAMLQIKGTNGTIKMDLKEEELKKIFKKAYSP